MAERRGSQEEGVLDPGSRPDASETTPLLASSTAPTAPAGDPDVAEALTHPPLPSSSQRPEDKPLPKKQILLLCYARLIEPITFFSIFPYINAMIARNGGVPDSDLGFYSGLIESLFSLTQMLVMVLWGRLADRAGRKPVLVVSLLGVAVATALFGLSRTLGQMVAARCAAGVFAGSIVTIRTMIGEHSTPKTQARSFSWFAFAGNVGIFLGPLIGGALADPAGQYPRVFGGVWFFETFPYALSGLVVACIALSAVVTSALFVDETLRRSRPSPGPEAGGVSPPKPGAAMSTWRLLKSPGVAIVIYNYGHVMLLAFAYTAIIPVFWYTRVALGGLGFSPLRISLFMGLSGLAQAVWLLGVFPRLQRRLGTNGVMRACGNCYPVFMLVQPLLNAMLRYGGDGEHGGAALVAFWVLAPLLLALGSGVSMAFTAAQLALNDVSPSHETLGMLNALALTVTSALRSFSPALFASLFAIGARNQWVWGYFVWIILAALALGFTVATRFLPAASEKDTGSLPSEPEPPCYNDDETVTEDESH
ncbi:major facilitator superfamily transporter [Xylariomycetidae sp. FL0641]|nr:major facilitator superfamily transporter [Xylariomycetidae sp. FL0641]